MFRPSKGKTTDEDEAFTGEIKKHQDLEVNNMYWILKWVYSEINSYVFKANQYRMGWLDLTQNCNG